MAQESTTMTATELLRQQHENVKQMFSQLVPSTGGNRTDLFNCLRATLAIHETAEEMVVYPELRGLGEEGRRFADERIEEEGSAKEVLADLEKIGPDGEGFDEKFEQFRKAVLQHAEAEESTVFPLLESQVSREKLLDMAESIEFAERMAPTHPHPHGPDSAIGNLLVGPFASMIDRVRDKMAERKSA
jgi:hemerythrin superfamily protein